MSGVKRTEVTQRSPPLFSIRNLFHAPSAGRILKFTLSCLEPRTVTSKRLDVPTMARVTGLSTLMLRRMTLGASFTGGVGLASEVWGGLSSGLVLEGLEVEAVGRRSVWLRVGASLRSVEVDVLLESFLLPSCARLLDGFVAELFELRLRVELELAGSPLLPPGLEVPAVEEDFGLSEVARLLEVDFLSDFGVEALRGVGFVADFPPDALLLLGELVGAGGATSGDFEAGLVTSRSSRASSGSGPGFKSRVSPMTAAKATRVTTTAMATRRSLGSLGAGFRRRERRLCPVG